MRQTATQVETETDTIRPDLQGLLTRPSALQGQWIGGGNTAFLSARTRYKDANVRLNQALVENARLIKSNEARYTADDAQASTALTSAGARLSDLTIASTGPQRSTERSNEDYSNGESANAADLG